MANGQRQRFYSDDLITNLLDRICELSGEVDHRTAQAENATADRDAYKLVALRGVNALREVTLQRDDYKRRYMALLTQQRAATAPMVAPPARPSSASGEGIHAH